MQTGNFVFIFFFYTCKICDCCLATGMLLYALCDILYNLMFVVKESEQLRACVVSGQRPDLNVITGPEPLRSHTVHLISRCWHQSPDERPAFAGIYCTNCRFTGKVLIFTRDSIACKWCIRSTPCFVLG